MDDRSFDLLVKRLSERRTRRTSVRALAGGALSAVVLADASTDAKKKKKKCKAPKVKCGRKLCCAAGQQCVDGACVTPTTTTSVKTTVTSTSTTTSTTPAPSVCTPSCGEGQQCVNQTCTCNVALCNQLTNPNQGQVGCFCDLTADGQTRCLANQQCSGHVDCGVGGSCPSGFVCQTFGCGNQPTCVKTCV
ncbi:MAG: hypothetical protein U0075_14735 [Thermomicrobiales bacterium]